MECDCENCPECRAEKKRLIALIMNAVNSGERTEEQVLDAIVKNTDRPEVVAMVEDYRIQKED